MFVNELRRNLPLDEFGVVKYGVGKIHVSDNTLHFKSVKGMNQVVSGLFTRLAPADHLKEHRVVVHTYYTARLHSAIKPDVLPLRPEYLVSNPVEGRKLREGSSALILASMDQPLILTSCWARGSVSPAPTLS